MNLKAEQLYEQARALEPEARAAFIERACAGDPQLRAELASLLEKAEAAEAYFDLLGDVVLRSMASGPDPNVGVTIGHYQVLARIGSGGMGTVYRAHDTKLDRDVALKFLPPYLSGQLEAQNRLLAEARAAAGLEHPNVCTIHEISATEDGQPFIAMGLCKGQTLKERLRAGPLPVDEVIAITRQIASGLAAAHARGIVHRDVKPANVMLEGDGTVRILDFGLAEMNDGTIKRPGLTPGTLAYMSPEQARGEALDQRSDLWSLGAVLYEMLSGVRPFRGDNHRALLDAILNQQPAPLSELRPDTPRFLTRAVERLLNKDVNARYARAAQLSADLSAASARREVPFSRRMRTFSAAGVVLVAVLGAAFWPNGRDSPTEEAAALQRVIVADFDHFGVDALLADGVSRVLRIDLARSSNLRVAGTSTVAAALQRMRREPDARLGSELAREVAVREGIPAVIEGEVRKLGASYVVAASVIEASTGETVGAWREVAQDSTEVISAIDRVSKAIRNQLGESLRSLKKEEPLWRSTTTSLAALRKHAEATRLFYRGEYAHAALLYDEAIRLDPRFIMAYVGLAYSGGHNMPRRRILEAYIKAYELRDRASESERYLVTANYESHVLGDVSKAIESYRKQVDAAKLAGEAPLYASLMGSLVLVGDFASAEPIGWEARELRPTALGHANLIKILYRRGKHRESDALLEEALRRFPKHGYLTLLKVSRQAAAGNYAASDSLANEILRPLVDEPHYVYAINAAVRGRITNAISHLQAQREFLFAKDARVAAIETAIAIARLRHIGGSTAVAVRELDDFVATVAIDSMDALDRPYLALARFYAEAGQPRRARTYLADYERAVPKIFRGAEQSLWLRTRGAIRLAEGAARPALKDFEEASRYGQKKAGDSYVLLNERPELARAYDRAGRADAAIATFERYLEARSINRTDIDAFELGPALYRVAELHEARNDAAAAARYYRRFAELWQAADPDLQPRVQMARRRADSLTTKQAP